MSRLFVRIESGIRALATLAARRRPPRDVRRILVAHYLLLGDTLLLAPLLKALRTRYPEAEIVVLARPAAAPLFEGRPSGAVALSFDRRSPADHRRVLASGPYDLAFVPDDNRYAWLARAAGARRVVAFAHDRPVWKNWMVDDAVPYPDRPAAWCDIVPRAFANLDPAPFARDDWPMPASSPFAPPPGRYVVLHVGASTPLKLWPADRWRAVADHLKARGLTVAWSGGANERGVVEAVGVAADEVDLVGALDLPQLWRLLAEASLLVCPDTGVMHLARLVGVPTVALFGPGSSLVHGSGAFWAAEPFEAITAVDFPCRNQRTLYRREIAWVRRCGRRFDPMAEPAGRGDPSACGRALCMEAIGTGAVIAATDRALSARRGP